MGPEEGEGATDLRVGIDVLLSGLLAYDDLLELTEVGNVAVLVDATM